MPRYGGRDWQRIRWRLQRQPSRWMLLAKGESASLADALRKGNIGPMHDVQVTTRNNTMRNGVRRCDIYLKLEDK